MRPMLQFSRAIDAVNGRVGRAAAWLILAMTLVSAGNAVSRKLFSASSNAFLEVQWVMFAGVFLLAAGYTLLSNQHVRVDLLHGRLSTRARLWVELAGTLLFLLPFAALVLRLGWPYFAQSFATAEVSLQAGGLVLWPAKLLIPAGFLLLLLQGLSQAIKIVAALRGLLPAEALFERTGAGRQADGADPEAAGDRIAR